MAETSERIRIQPRGRRDNGPADLAKAYRAVQKLFRQSRRSTSSGGAPKIARKGHRAPPTRLQRVSVRLTYSGNRVGGQWGAHGRYLARESAASHAKAAGVGFDSTSADLDLAGTAAEWQTAGDPRMFKLILSPEFGERMDLRTFTRDYLYSLEKDLGRPLQWVAVDHYNTDHPHVHVMLRGVDRDGDELRIDRGYIAGGLRARAQELATKELGYRTQDDIDQARDRQVEPMRYTELDQSLQRIADTDGVVTIDSRLPRDENARAERLRRLRRLQTLTRAGLAERDDERLSWRLHPQLRAVLNTHQKATDRLRSFHAHQEAFSDPNVPLQVTDPRKVEYLSGRVIATGLDDASNREYLLLEGTDGRAHFIHHDSGPLQKARGQGELAPGHFVRLERKVIEGRDMLIVRDHGDAELFLKDVVELQREAFRLRRHGIETGDKHVGGWLGRYHHALTTAGAKRDRGNRTKTDRDLSR